MKSSAHTELLLTHKFAFVDIGSALECVSSGLRGVIKAVLFFSYYP